MIMCRTGGKIKKKMGTCVTPQNRSPHELTTCPSSLRAWGVPLSSSSSSDKPIPNPAFSLLPRDCQACCPSGRTRIVGMPGHLFAGAKRQQIRKTRPRADVLSPAEGEFPHVGFLQKCNRVANSCTSKLHSWLPEG